MRDSLVASNPCQRPTLHPSLANARWRGITLSFHTTRRGGGTPPCRVCLSSLDTTKRGDPPRCVYGFYSMRRGGKPSPSRLFDFIRRDEEGKPSLSCLFDVRCDKAPNTKSVPVWVYSWCSNFVPSPSNRTCKTCPDGHVLHVWCCLQHRAPETRPFGCFLVLGSFPIPCRPTTPPSLNTRDRGVLFN